MKENNNIEVENQITANTPTDPEHTPRTTPTESDQVRPSPTQSDRVRLPNWITLDEVYAMFVAEGLERSRTLLQRYCRQRRLIGIKDAGPNGDEWFVDPTSVPKVIAELKRINRVSPTPTDPEHANDAQEGVDDHDRPKTTPNIHPEQPRPSPTESDSVRPSPTQSDLDIYSHPYVKRLEEDVDHWRSEYKHQVKVTQEIQREAFEKISEIQRINQIGQSEELSRGFMNRFRSLFGKNDVEIDDDSEVKSK